MSTGGVPDDEHPVEIEGSIDTGEVDRRRCHPAFPDSHRPRDRPADTRYSRWRTLERVGSLWFGQVAVVVLRQNPPWMKAITANGPSLPWGVEGPELLRRVAVPDDVADADFEDPRSVMAGVVSSPCPSAPHAARTAKTTRNGRTHAPLATSSSIAPRRAANRSRHHRVRVRRTRHGWHRVPVRAGYPQLACRSHGTRAPRRSCRRSVVGRVRR